MAMDEDYTFNAPLEEPSSDEDYDDSLAVDHSLANGFFGSATGTLDITLLEKGVLSAILFQPDDINIAANIVSPSDFQHPKNITIYSMMMDFYQANKPLDAMLLADALDRAGTLHRAGGIEYFMELADTSTLWSTGNTLEYCMAIRENSRLRQMQGLARDIQEKTHQGSGASADDILQYAYGSLQKFAENSTEEDTRTLHALAGDTIGNVVAKSQRDPSLSFTGIPSGFIDLDKLTNGFQPGQMIIIAGRPGMGKSTGAMNIATTAALFANKTVLFYTLEMTKEELMMKILSSTANVPHDVIKRGAGLTMDHLTALNATHKEMEDKNLIIRDTPDLNMPQLRSQCIMQKASPEGLDMVVIDYIGLMNTSDLSRESRQDEVSKLSRALKLLAKELQVPVIVLAQLNRGSEKAPDKTPMVSHLRESGSLEQDADMVILVHRPEYYDPNDRPGIAEFIIGKHRGGETAKIEMLSLLEYSKFGNSAGKYISDMEPESDDSYGDPYADANYSDASVEPTNVNDSPVDPGSSGPAW